MVCYLHRPVRNPSDIPYQPGVSAVKDPVAGRKRYRCQPKLVARRARFPRTSQDEYARSTDHQHEILEDLLEPVIMLVYSFSSFFLHIAEYYELVQIDFPERLPIVSFISPEPQRKRVSRLGKLGST